MSNYTNLADFSTEGFNLGKDTRVMSYLHGLSDFWVYMFEDASKINLLMEANAVTASDVYNKFLQLTSIISLEEISVLTNSQVKLILLSSSDAVKNKVETYTFPEGTDLKYARYLVNRAYLPTTKLENEADYYIDEATGQISFAQPLSTLGFPFRTLSDGTRQYALWAIDAKVDDQLIYNYYAKLISIDPTASTDLFKNFVYGMYYLFVQGPHLETMKRGLNIALGIPLARDTETVLETRKYLNTDQWLVITDLNSYLIPYGLEPTVKEGDQITVGQELAVWIEVKDYINDGDWWINFMLPSQLMPNIPSAVPGGGGVVADSDPDRYMTAGSYSDWIMRNYLKNHTFLVNVKTLGFKNVQSFEQLSDIIRQVKPAYTAPIYVWSVPMDQEPIQVVEQMIELVLARERCECITEGINRFRRDSGFPLLRGNCPKYTRMSAPSSLDALMGFDPELNQQRSFNSGMILNYIAPGRTYSTLAASDLGWLNTFRTRANDQFIPTHGSIDFFRNYATSTDGIGVKPLQSNFPGMRMVYLYTTTLQDLTDKFNAANATIPAGKYFFTLFKPSISVDLVNEHGIDDSRTYSYLPVISANFDYYFKPGTYSRFLTPMFGEDSFQTYCPSLNDVMDTDYLAFTAIADNCFGVFWVTSNFATVTPAYWPHAQTDTFNVKFSAPINRGGAALGSPFYLTRGSGVGIGYNNSVAVNTQPVNDGISGVADVSVTYSDNLNSPFTVDRSGNVLSISRTWK